MRPVVSIVTCTISGTVRPASLIARRHGDDRGLGLQEVVDGLDEQHVGAAFEEARGLQLVVVAQLGEVDRAERREPGARARSTRSRSAGRSGRGELVRDLAGDRAPRRRSGRR